MGPKDATIRLQDNASGSPQTVMLAGLGVWRPAWKLSAGHLKFAHQSVGTISAAKTLTVTNRGTAAVRLDSIFLSGREADDFVLREKCGPLLAANASCSLSVSFKPSVERGQICDRRSYRQRRGFPSIGSAVGNRCSARTITVLGFFPYGRFVKYAARHATHCATYTVHFAAGLA